MPCKTWKYPKLFPVLLEWVTLVLFLFSVQPNALQSNQVVIEAFVVDVNDEQPVAKGFTQGLPNKYYIGIADNVAYNTTIFQLDVSLVLCIQ